VNEPFTTLPSGSQTIHPQSITPSGVLHDPSMMTPLRLSATAACCPCVNCVHDDMSGQQDGSKTLPLCNAIGLGPSNLQSWLGARVRWCVCVWGGGDRDLSRAHLPPLPPSAKVCHGADCLPGPMLVTVCVPAWLLCCAIPYQYPAAGVHSKPQDRLQPGQSGPLRHTHTHTLGTTWS